MAAESKTSVRRSRRIGAKLALLIVTVLLSVGAAELGLRIAGISYPKEAQPDVDLGYRYRPGLEWTQSDEGHAEIRINATGFRDDDHEQAKPDGVLRIAILGDSMVAALEVAQEERFSEVLERELGSRSSFGTRRASVMNFGVGGFGTAQELLTFRKVASGYEPDLVVLAFLPTNDFLNNTKRLNHSEFVPYFELEDGELVLDDSFLTHPRFVGSWTRNLQDMRLAQLLRRGRLVWQERKRIATKRGSAQPAEGFDVPPTSEAWKESWAVTEALIARLHKEVTASGARFLLAVLPDHSQVLPGEAGAAATPFVPSYTDQRLTNFAQGHGISIITLAAPLAQYATAERVHLHGFANTTPGTGHFNEHGHLVVGRVLASKIEELWN